MPSLKLLFLPTRVADVCVGGWGHMLLNKPWWLLSCVGFSQTGTLETPNAQACPVTRDCVRDLVHKWSGFSLSPPPSSSLLPSSMFPFKLSTILRRHSYLRAGQLFFSCVLLKLTEPEKEQTVSMGICHCPYFCRWPKARLLWNLIVKLVLLLISPVIWRLSALNSCDETFGEATEVERSWICPLTQLWFLGLLSWIRKAIFEEYKSAHLFFFSKHI